MPTSRRIRREFTPEERANWEKLVAQEEEDREKTVADVRRRKADSLIRRELHHTMSALDDARQHQGVSLADLRDRTGIERGNLSKLLSGDSNPTLQTVARIAAALGLKLTVELEPLAATASEETDETADLDQ